MGKRLEQTFFQIHTNSQQVHEKVLNIMNHKGNANQNHSITSHLAIIKKTPREKCWQDVEKKEHMCTVDENVKWCSHYEKQYGGPQKIQSRVTILSPNPMSSYISKGNEITFSERYLHHPPCSFQHYSQQPRDGNNISIYQQING